MQFILVLTQKNVIAMKWNSMIWMILNQAQESAYKVLALIVTFPKGNGKIFQRGEAIKLSRIYL